MCEHQQEFGFECEVCGKDLSDMIGLIGPPPVAIERLEAMEVTVADRVGDVPLDQVADLQMNALPAAPDAPVATTPDLELSSQAPVGEVQVERIGDFTNDRAVDDGLRTKAPAGALTCRYCRNVQATGTICERCGMHLPTAMQITAKGPPEEWTRCKACGAPGVIGQRCKECGRLVPHPDA